MQQKDERGPSAGAGEVLVSGQKLVKRWGIFVRFKTEISLT
jgi:hypothetical protein